MLKNRPKYIPTPTIILDKLKPDVISNLDLKIGTRFLYQNNVFKVVEDNSIVCKSRCDLSKFLSCQICPKCGIQNRSDNTYVVFKLDNE